MSERIRLPHDPAGYITREDLITFLLAYFEGELSAAEEREFGRHLAVCPACVAYLKTYREAIRFGRGALAGIGASGDGGADGTGGSAATIGAVGERPPQLEAELVEAILAARRLSPKS